MVDYTDYVVYFHLKVIGIPPFIGHGVESICLKSSLLLYVALCTALYTLTKLCIKCICNTHLTTHGYSWSNSTAKSSDCVVTHIFEGLSKSFTRFLIKNK